MNTKRNIGLGIIAGSAVGDALGAPLEFLPPRSKDAFATEMEGGGMLKWKPGEITDDTIMALSIMDMYNKHGEYNQEAVVESWVKWRRTNPKDIGNWTYRVLGKWGMYRDRSKVLRGTDNPAVMLWQQRDRRDAGNGSVMRCMPTAVARNNNLDLLTKESVWLSEDTHPDPRCVISCLVVNKLLKFAFDGMEKRAAYDKIMAEVYEIGDLNLLDAFEKAPTLAWDEWDNNGYTVDTVKCAMAAWLQHDSFEDALVHIVNRGNDADTVGAVTGALMGAYHGFDSIPQRWWDGLGKDMKKTLTDNTEMLLEISDQ